MHIQPRGVNKFLLTFKRNGDHKRVYNGGPWEYEGSLIALKRVEGHERVDELEIDQQELWVQIHGVSPDMLKYWEAKQFSKMLGGVTEIDVSMFGMSKHPFLRTRRLTGIHIPLRQTGRFRDGKGTWHDIEFNYEGLGCFCYVCGHLDHGKQDCPVLQDSSNDNQMMFGPWLRATPSAYQQRYMKTWTSPKNRGQDQSPKAEAARARQSGRGKGVQGAETSSTPKSTERKGNQLVIYDSPKQQQQCVEVAGMTTNQLVTFLTQKQQHQNREMTASASNTSQQIDESGKEKPLAAGYFIDGKAQMIGDLPLACIEAKAGEIIFAKPGSLERKIKKFKSKEPVEQVGGRAERQLNFDEGVSSKKESSGSEDVHLMNSEESERSHKKSKNSEVGGEANMLEGEIDSGIPLGDEDYGINFEEEEGDNIDMIQASEVATPPRPK